MPDEMQGKPVNFVMVEDRGAQNTLACPACGKIFDIDAHTQENLVWSKEYKGVVAQCPDCKATQIAEEETPKEEKK